jgi:Ser/Thr protein kinase RdoA (MazF antagonist)
MAAPIEPAPDDGPHARGGPPATRPFDALGRAGRTRRLVRLAAAALASYDVVPARIVPLTRGFNSTFRVDTTGGERLVLRVQRRGGPDPVMVRSEMAWLTALRRDTDLVVPDPVPTRAGDLQTVVTADGVPQARSCVLYRWVEGRFVDEQLTEGHLARVGAFTARLHVHGAAFVPPPGFRRGAVDHVTTVGRTQDDGLSAEVAGRAADVVGALRPDGGRLVRAVVERARTARAEIGRGPDAYGLIHADLHQENYLFHRGRVRAIDFDDCGYGPFVYDLAVTLSELTRRAGYPALRAAMLAGYRTVRSLPAGHERFIDTFIALRHLQLTMWAVEHRTEPMFRDSWRRWLDDGLAAIRNVSTVD